MRAIVQEKARRPPRLGQRVEPLAPAAFDRLRFREHVVKQQRIVHLLSVAGIRPRFRSDPVDGRLVERTKVAGALRVEPAPRHDGVGSALFERCIVEVGVGLGGQDLLRQRGGLGQVASEQRELSRLHAPEEPLEPVDVHRLVKAILDGLLDERVIGDVAIPRNVFEARDLVGKAQGEEVLRFGALKIGRDLLSAAESEESESARGVPPPSGLEHRRVEHGLDQHAANVVWLQEAKHVFERKAVRRAERQDDGVFDRRRLKLDVEAAAKPLSERQAPGAVDSAPHRRVNDEVHRARLVEEAFEHDGVFRGHRVEGDSSADEILGELSSGHLADGGLLHEPVDEGRDVLVPGVDAFANRVHRLREQVGPSGRLAKPEGKGGGRTGRVGDTHDTRLYAENLIGMIAELKDIAGRTFEREVFVDRSDSKALGFEAHLEVEVVGDRAAVGDGGEPRASSRAYASVDLVAM